MFVDVGTALALDCQPNTHSNYWMNWLHSKTIVHSACLQWLLDSYWNAECFSASDCETWEAKVELILSTLLAKAVAFCLHATEMCFYPHEARLFSFLYLLLCLKYIILLLLITKKAGLSLSRFQECGNWILHLKVNFRDGITQISLSLVHPFASIHLSFILHHLDASLHLMWFTLFIWWHLFSCSTARLMFFHFALLRCRQPTCVCVCVCVWVCACVYIHKFLVQAFSTAKIGRKKKSQTLKAITPLKFNAFGQCNLTIRRVSYLFIFLSIHLYWKRGELAKLCLWSELGEEDLMEQRHTLIQHNPTSPRVNLSFCLSKTYSETETTYRR